MTMENQLTQRNLPTIQRILSLPEGKRVYLRCPAGTHRDSTPSFVVYPDGSFHCFGCNVHGKGSVNFLMRVLNNTYEDAIDYLTKF
jgi:DNA primase